MDEQKQSLIARIKQAQNILVTVSANPTVDQLAAAIGLTLALNKLDKHGTAVFSGQVPSTIEFLKPEDTLEKNTDSLRDFIIALDKSKADKLRYKVEDQVVRIFITPYKTSLSQTDLDFSQGDFNVDVVVALGVTEQQDLDVAITAHGRILHDATVVSVSTVGQGSLGAINWVDPASSSLSEMIVSLADGLDKQLIDNQIATALLTGIVASTERFSNDKTSPRTMSASAELMAAGANQQLIATQLETPPAPVADSSSYNQPSTTEEPQDTDEKLTKDEPEKPKPEPGTLEIDHETNEADKPDEEPEPTPEPPHPQVQVDEDGHFVSDADQLNNAAADETGPQISGVRGGGSYDTQQATGDTPEVQRQRMVDPPRMGDTNLTANSEPEALDLPTEELSLPSLNSPILTHNESTLSSSGSGNSVASNPFSPPAPAPLQPAPQDWQAQQAAPVLPDTTLAEIEQSVDSPHLHAEQAQSDTAMPAADTVDDARSAVEAAFNGGTSNGPLDPITALNAQPLGPELHAESAPEQPAPAFATPAPFTVPNTGFNEPTPGNTPADDALDMPLPSNPFGPGQQVTPSPFTPPAAPLPPSAFPSTPQQPGMPLGGQTPPPPVPPPMLPPLQ